MTWLCPDCHERHPGDGGIGNNWSCPSCGTTGRHNSDCIWWTGSDECDCEAFP